MSLVKIELVKTHLYNQTESKTEVGNNKKGASAAMFALPTKEEIEKLTPQQLEIHKMVARQKITATQFDSPEMELDLEINKVTYVTASNGVFRLLRTPIAIFSECVTEFENPLFHLNPLCTGFQLMIPKMDMKELLKALTFYRDVHKKDKTEASLLYFWNHTDDINYENELAQLKDLPGIQFSGHENRLIIYSPIQKNSSGLSDFEADVWVPWLREHTTGLLETHSHHTMGAFWSGTDDANENMNQFYLVWGEITKDKPAQRFRYCYMGKKYELRGLEDKFFNWPVVTMTTRTVEVLTTTTTVDMGIVGDFSQVSSTETNASVLAQFAAVEPKIETIETPKDEVKTLHYPGPFEAVDYPEAFMSQHKKSGIATTTYAGSYGGGYGYDHDWRSRSNYGRSHTHTPASKVTGAIDYTPNQRVDFESVVYDVKLGKYVDAESGK